MFGDYDAASGYIFAQCVTNPFWCLRLDVNTEAHALIAQMAFRYSSYHFEENCLVRSKVFHRHAAVIENNSPVKQAPVAD